MDCTDGGENANRSEIVGDLSEPETYVSVISMPPELRSADIVGILDVDFLQNDR